MVFILYKSLIVVKSNRYQFSVDTYRVSLSLSISLSPPPLPPTKVPVFRVVTREVRTKDQTNQAKQVLILIYILLLKLATYMIGLLFLFIHQHITLFILKNNIKKLVVGYPFVKMTFAVC